MAKHSMANYQKQNVTMGVLLGALAGNDLIAFEGGASLEEPCRVTSIEGTWALRGLTAGEGPIIFGVANADYTDAEIEECLEQATTRPGDLVDKEKANR